MTENNGFYYNAPNYHDFSSNIVVEGVDSFFDYAHNHDCSQTVSDLEKPLMTLPKIKMEVISPDNEQTLKISSSPNNISKESQNVTDTMTPRLIKKGVRRSSILQPAFPNVEDILIQNMENLEVIPLQGKLSTTKCHHMTTRLDKCIATPKLDLRSRSVVRSDTVNENRKRKGSPMQETQNKFMGMEERIMRFENSSRFPSQELSKNVQKNKKLHTVAKTPNLMAIHRTRPVNFTTHQEKEELELQEIRTNQIKAAPFNKAILEKVSVPMKPAAKPTTKPYPFKLTEITKKPVASVEPYHFSAKPIPEAVLKSPKLRPLRNRPLKVSVLQVSKDSYIVKQVEIPHQGLQTQKKTEKRLTAIEPFSFDQKDKERYANKENKIKQYLEEEKKAREFHANPLPNFVTSKIKDPTHLTKPDALIQTVESQFEHRKEYDKENKIKPFKARPATVIKQKPFEPTKPERILQSKEIELYTEKRALEREAFDLRIKQNEQLIEHLKRERAMELKQLEEKEIIRLRREAIHKAMPVPKFKTPVLKKSEKPLTDPQSPFRTNKR